MAAQSSLRDLDRSEYLALDGRNIASIQNPRPMVIAGCHDGKLIGLASIIWTTPVSHTPPLFAFALRDRSFTLNMILNTRIFSLSFLEPTPESVEIAEYCGSRSGYKVDKADHVAHSMVPVVTEGAHVGRVPVVDNALSWATCKVISTQKAGDHILVIGEVVEAATKADQAQINEKGVVSVPDTLLCIHHGDYGQVAPLN